MVKLNKFLNLYDLEVDKVVDLDLTKCFMQARPNKPLDEILVRDGRVDYSISNSPHREFADLLFQKGDEWLRLNYGQTRYCIMKTKLFKKPDDFPKRFVDLCNSLQMGYLRKGYEEDYIVVLDWPFANTRYKRDVPDLSPEIFSGHHRAGALIAMGKNKIKVVVAKDTAPGSKQCFGKIHDLCNEERK